MLIGERNDDFISSQWWRRVDSQPFFLFLEIAIVFLLVESSTRFSRISLSVTVAIFCQIILLVASFFMEHQRSCRSSKYSNNGYRRDTSGKWCTSKCTNSKKNRLYDSLTQVVRNGRSYKKMIYWKWAPYGALPPLFCRQNVHEMRTISFCFICFTLFFT